MSKIDFSKKKFLKAFKKYGLERNDAKMEDNWFYIIENHVDLTPEENLARLVWKGIIAETEEYLKEVDECL